MIFMTTIDRHTNCHHLFAKKYLQMVLTLFDGAVMTGCIPAIIESGDESFIRSYSERVIAPALVGHVS